METIPRLGVGLAYQPALRGFIVEHAEAFDFLEVVPDILWTDRGPGESPRYVEDQAGVAFLREVRRAKRVVPHSIGLSIGSAHRFNRAHLDQLAAWHDWLDFPWHSDHLSYCLTAICLLQRRAATGHAFAPDAEMNVGLTMPLPRDRETLDLLLPRIAEVRARVAAPFLLENNVAFFDLPGAEYSEAGFLNALCEGAGCGLVLDLHNLYVNSRNLGVDPDRFLDELDLDAVVEIHVAGGMEYGGYYLDAHSGPIPEPVWRFLDRVVGRCPNLGGVVFELFGSWFPEMGAERLSAELRQMRACWSRYLPEPAGVAG